MTITGTGTLRTTGTGTNEFYIGAATFENTTTGNVSKIIAGNSGKNTVNFLSGSKFTGQALFNGDGTTGYAGATGVTEFNFETGSSVAKPTASVNTVYVHGSDQTNAANIFNIRGGYIDKTATGTATATWLYGGKVASGNTSTFNLISGSVGNINGLDFAAGNAADAGFTSGIAVGGKTAVVTGDFSGANYVNNMWNLDLITLTKGGNLTLGFYDLTGSPYADPLIPSIGKGSTVSQITANTVDVNAGSKFMIHDDVNAGVTNIINYLHVKGEANINQTTITGLGTYTVPSEPDPSITAGRTDGAFVRVANGGILYGFGTPTNPVSDPTPLSPNVYGDLYVERGGKVKPFDATVFDIVTCATTKTLWGVTFQVEKTSSAYGKTTFDQGSILSTRMFANTDSRTFTPLSDATVHNTSFSDSVQSDSFDFKNVWNNGAEVVQKDKVQYDPVFGFHYELRSKQDFKIYRGDGVNDTTYYYKIAEGDQNIAEIMGGYTDANHLFNQDIIKSDMIGEWWFEISATTQEIGLRFRLLAEHPTKGGFVKDAITPNSRSAVTILDVWRYPFATAYTGGLNLPDDPSIANALNPTGYAFEGYTGDMQTHYASKPHYYTKYQPKYIADFEQFLLQLQYASTSGHDLERSHRQIHAESYADLPTVNINIMKDFRNTIERVGMSNLYQVESYRPADEAGPVVSSDFALANIEGCVPQYVCNPLRFWSSGFGTTERQRDHGTEYGFNTQNWGGAVGAVKEWGDWYFGLSAGYANSRTTWEDLNASARTDAYLLETRVGLRRGMAFYEVFGAYSYNDQRMERTIRVAKYAGDVTGSYHDDVYSAGARVGYQLPFGQGKWLFVPTLGLEYTTSLNSPFTEVANRDDLSLALDFERGRIERTSLTVPVMARLSRVFAFGRNGTILTPEIRAGFSPVFGDRGGISNVEFIGMPIPDLYFESVGIDQGRFAGQLGATLELSRRGRFWIAGNYDLTFRAKDSSHSYSLQAGYNF